MSFFSQIQKIGSRLGLMSLATESTADRPCTKIETRTVPIAEITAQIKTAKVNALAARDHSLSLPIEQIHTSAGLSAPAHGWSAMKVAERLRQPDCAVLSKEQAQVLVLNELAKSAARVEDVVRDAVSRDRAVDAFAEKVRERLIDARKNRLARRQDIAIALKNLSDEDTALALANERDQSEWTAWWQGKLAAEKDLAWALSFLIDAKEISVDERVPPLDAAP